MGSHMSAIGSALGSSAAAPGTNSLGTALPSDGVGNLRGPLLGTNRQGRSEVGEDERLDLPRLSTAACTRLNV